MIFFYTRVNYYLIPASCQFPVNVFDGDNLIIGNCLFFLLPHILLGHSKYICIVETLIAGAWFCGNCAHIFHRYNSTSLTWSNLAQHHHLSLSFWWLMANVRGQYQRGFIEASTVPSFWLDNVLWHKKGILVFYFFMEFQILQECDECPEMWICHYSCIILQTR